MASQEGNNSSAAGSSSSSAVAGAGVGVGVTGGASAGAGADSAALFSKLRSFSIGSGPNSPQRVVSNLRGFLTHRLSNITPSDTGEYSFSISTFFPMYLCIFSFPVECLHNQRAAQRKKNMHIIKIKQLFANTVRAASAFQAPPNPHPSPTQRCPLANTHQDEHTHTLTHSCTHSLTNRNEFRFTAQNERSAASHSGTRWNGTVTVRLRLRQQHERYANLCNASEC